MLKAVIFDLDDTLLDWSGRTGSWQDYDREHLRHVFDYVTGQLHPLRDFEGFVQEARQRTIAAWVEAEQDLQAPHLGYVLVETLGALGVPWDLLDVEACLRAYNWLGFPGVVPYPETAEVLAELRAQDLKLGIVTNAFHPMWVRDAELAGLGIPPDWFACRLASADVGYLKPHPAIFTRALTCLGIDAAEAVFVGDNLQADISGAQDAGIYAVFRTAAHRVDDVPAELRDQIRPDSTISDLRQLFACLDARFPGWRNDGG